MQDLVVITAIAGFALMVIGAIAKAVPVTVPFAILELTPAGARAVAVCRRRLLGGRVISR